MPSKVFMSLPPFPDILATSLRQSSILSPRWVYCVFFNVLEMYISLYILLYAIQLFWEDILHILLYSSVMLKNIPIVEIHQFANTFIILWFGVDISLISIPGNPQTHLWFSCLCLQMPGPRVWANTFGFHILEGGFWFVWIILARVCEFSHAHVTSSLLVSS